MKIAFELVKVFICGTGLFYGLMLNSVLYVVAFHFLRGKTEEDSLAIATFKKLSLADNKIRLALSGGMLFTIMYISYEEESNRILAALLALVAGFVFYYNYKTLRINYLKHTIYPILIFTLCIVVFVGSLGVVIGITGDIQS